MFVALTILTGTVLLVAALGVAAWIVHMRLVRWADAMIVSFGLPAELVDNHPPALSRDENTVAGPSGLVRSCPVLEASLDREVAQLAHS